MTTELWQESPSQYGSVQIFHHHVFLGLWNEESRFVNLPLDKESMIVYVGANNHGADGKKLLDMFNW